MLVYSKIDVIQKYGLLLFLIVGYAIIFASPSYAFNTFTETHSLEDLQNLLAQGDKRDFRTHPWLAEQAIKVFEQFYQIDLPQEFENEIMMGSIEEDADLVESSTGGPPEYTDITLDDELIDASIKPPQNQELACIICALTVPAYNRAENHFFDGTGGLNYGYNIPDGIVPFGFGVTPFSTSAIEWATDSAINAHTWKKAVARGNTREGWRSFGHLLHLLQDMGVPGHTRNDIHAPWPFFGGSEPYEGRLSQQSYDAHGSYGSIDLSKIIESLIMNGPKGYGDINSFLLDLSTYVRRAYFSTDTIFQRAFKGRSLPINDDIASDGFRYEPVADEFYIIDRGTGVLGQGPRLLAMYGALFKMLYELNLVDFPQNIDEAIQLSDFLILDDDPLVKRYWADVAPRIISMSAELIKLFYDEVTPPGPVLITVNSTEDDLTAGDDKCTLREAMSNANANSDTTGGDCPAGGGDDEIVLPAGTYILAIEGTAEDAAATGDLDITANLTINGAGATTTIIDGGGLDRVIQTIGSGTTLVLNGVTIRNGAAGSNDGGGILASGPLIINNSIITGNQADQGAGIVGNNITLIDSQVDGNVGTDQGGGIWFCCGDATFTITHSSVSSNQSGDQGGGIFFCCGDLTLTITDSSISDNTADYQGGGIFFCCGDDDSTASSTTITITRSSINSNTASDDGGGLFYCCGGTAGDTISVTDSTINSNIAGDDGGGIFVCCPGIGGTTLTIARSDISGNTSTASEGGGLWTDSGAASLTDITISANTAATDGGGIFNLGTLTATNSTISSNSAGDEGGGIFSCCPNAILTLTNTTINANTAGRDGGGIFGIGTVDVTNTIIANSQAGGDCSGVINSYGHNLDSDGTCSLMVLGDLPNTDPLLGPLQDNGGTTLTHALLAGSPAIDAGDNTACPPTDQRGIIRPQGGVCDIGAYEFTTQ